MGILTDIMKGMPLNIIQEQKLKEQEKHLIELEEENNALRERLARYEAKPGERCPMCQKPSFSLKSKRPHAMLPEGSGLDDYLFSCSDCGFDDAITAESAAQAWRKARADQ